MEALRITNVVVRGNRCSIEFATTVGLTKYFRSNVFYYDTDFPITNIPEQILIIPFLCNILPIIWLTDSELEVKNIDKSFYECLQSVKEGYSNMYPTLIFGGRIKYESIIEAKSPTGNNSTVCLYSGGVDANATAIRHLGEDLHLLSIRGSMDYPLDDDRGWGIHIKDLRTQSSQLKKPLNTIASNFACFIDNWGTLNNLIAGSNESWWHGFQHGIGLLGLSAPLAYVLGAHTVYIAASFSSKDARKETCASDPTIDNNLRFGFTQIIHDGYELTRQDKIGLIVNTEQVTELQLHVCLRQYQETNCCKCEKCIRTILGILAEGQNPKKFGFNISESDIAKIIWDLKYKLTVGHTMYYTAIQQRIIENKGIIKNKDILNFSRYPTQKLVNNPLKSLRENLEKSILHKTIMSIVHK